MKLENMTEQDLSLREEIESDPQMMEELGGPNSKEQIAGAHTKALAAAAAGTCLYLKVVPPDLESGAGYVGIWQSSFRDEPIIEMGWMILPRFQKRGLATQAAREALERAKSDRKFQIIHAFPGTTNDPSNALCSRLGFEKIEECDIEYQERPLRCNHWQIKLF